MIQFDDRSDGRRNLRIILEGYEVFGMTLGPVDPESHQWFAEILERQIDQAIQSAVLRARRTDQAAMRKLLGLGS